MPAAGIGLAPADFIRTRLALAPLPFYPAIALHRPTPQSGLTAWLAARDKDASPPYWAYAWAGGAALALYLDAHKQTVAGRRVLDFGAGSGLVGIAAARAGAARIWALEPDQLGQVALTLNAKANGVELALWTGNGLPPVDIILAGDVFYDAAVAAATLPLLREAAAAGTTVLVGDPFRRDLPLATLQLLAEYAVPDMGAATPVRAGVFRLTGP